MTAADDCPNGYPATHSQACDAVGVNTELMILKQRYLLMTHATHDYCAWISELQTGYKFFDDVDGAGKDQKEFPVLQTTVESFVYK